MREMSSALVPSRQRRCAKARPPTAAPAPRLWPRLTGDRRGGAGMRSAGPWLQGLGGLGPDARRCALAGRLRHKLSGTLAISAAPSAQNCGRQRRQAIGRLAASFTNDRLTATWQLSCFPSWPKYWRATPTECVHFLGMPMSSMIQARIAPCRSISGSTSCAPGPSRLHPTTGPDPQIAAAT